MNAPLPARLASCLKGCCGPTIWLVGTPPPARCLRCGGPLGPAAGGLVAVEAALRVAGELAARYEVAAGDDPVQAAWLAHERAAGPLTPAEVFRAGWDAALVYGVVIEDERLAQRLRLMLTVESGT